MKNITAVLIVIICLFSCKNKTNAPTASQIADVNLKRGDIIACGTGEESFGSVSFISSCGNKKDFNLAITLLHSAVIRATSRSPEHRRGARASVSISSRRRPRGCSSGPSCKAGLSLPVGPTRGKPRLKASGLPGLFNARM